MSYYEASGLKTHVLGCTHWAQTKSEAKEFREHLESLPTWEDVAHFVNTTPPFPQPPEPYPTDSCIGLTGYNWICAHD